MAGRLSAPLGYHARAEASAGFLLSPEGARRASLTKTFTAPTGHAIRSTLIDGEPWFVAADVCRALELPFGGASGSTAQYLRALKQDERRLVTRTEGNRSTLFANSRAPNMTLISESGLYKLPMRSDKEAAWPFQEWVTREVLPSIRKTGGYQLADHGRTEMQAAS